MRALTANNSYNLAADLIIEISLVLESAHVVSSNQDKVAFNTNNYIGFN